MPDRPGSVYRLPGPRRLTVPRPPAGADRGRKGLKAPGTARSRFRGAPPAGGCGVPGLHPEIVVFGHRAFGIVPAEREHAAFGRRPGRPDMAISATALSAIGRRALAGMAAGVRVRRPAAPFDPGIPGRDREHGPDLLVRPEDFPAGLVTAGALSGRADAASAARPGRPSLSPPRPCPRAP